MGSRLPSLKNWIVFSSSIAVLQFLLTYIFKERNYYCQLSQTENRYSSKEVSPLGNVCVPRVKIQGLLERSIGTTYELQNPFLLLRINSGKTTQKIRFFFLYFWKRSFIKTSTLHKDILSSASFWQKFSALCYPRSRYYYRDMSLETNYFIVFLFAQKRVRFGRDNLPFFRDFMGYSAPESPSPVWDVKRLSNSATKSRWETGHMFLYARKRRPCPETPGIFSHLVCTSVLCSHHVVPWHAWWQLLRDIILSATAATQHQHQVVLKLSWAADWQPLCSLYLPHPTNCSAPAIWSSSRHS